MEGTFAVSLVTKLDFQDIPSKSTCSAVVYSLADLDFQGIPSKSACSALGFQGYLSNRLVASSIADLDFQGIPSTRLVVL